jgi:hypothetical protein
LNHPSLRAKKFDEAKGRWQARVNDDWRFYFTIDRDTYRISEIYRASQVAFEVPKLLRDVARPSSSPTRSPYHNRSAFLADDLAVWACFQVDAGGCRRVTEGNNRKAQAGSGYG